MEATEVHYRENNEKGLVSDIHELVALYNETSDAFLNRFNDPVVMRMAFIKMLEKVAKENTKVAHYKKKDVATVADHIVTMIFDNTDTESVITRFQEKP